ncbi:hypothetical protein LLEC1_04790 [Akanthomyces lecanii]|uniref:Uncharacterized protein n=1 Tax=Cordyceps confragosa TaxID=2714763 RepID=A0A179I2W0_CORDF|nr:hypothetical protein LLEC1_04790 [Akanthomyces lecanii]
MLALDPEPGYKGAGSAPASNGPRRKGNANAASHDKTTPTASSDDADAQRSGSSRSSSPQDAASASSVAPATEMMTLREQLELEKSRYPGASTWAPDEARLFELLFFRQELAMLPSHWSVDLRGVPISSVNFATGENQPIIYAHGKEFLATTALVRLIELTASIRTTSESGLHQRVPGMIKAGLDKFLAWAAEDGGYSHLRVVPNVITEVVDAELQGSDITALLQRRMRALAPPASHNAETDGSAAAKRRRLFVSPISELDDLAMSGDSPSFGMLSYSSPSERQAAKRLLPSPPPPPPPTTIQYRRRPPVVYALFIINTTVFVLTVDAALDDDAYISFHVEIDFLDQCQSVWNALTLAMVSCLARDDMRRRLDDFEPLTEEEEESDPDA